MLRSAFSTAAIFFLLFSICTVPENVSARSRCPVKEPETLLSLYQNSDAIYIATFDKTVDGEITEDTPDYSAHNIKKHFSISSALKGESRKFVVLEDTDYKYKNTVQSSDESGDDEEYEDPESSLRLKPGDTLLLFLKNGEDGPALTDYRDGTKKLSMDHIGVYEARIRDLNAIFSSKKVNEARIVEWLVRCAEDPVTRWEGTFELLQSFKNLEWQKQTAEERLARIARGEPVEVEPEEETEAGDEEGDAEESTLKNVDTSSFAKLLDANQKQTLANILLNRPALTPDETEKEESEIAGDEELIELVKLWGDPRLVGFLIDELRANADDPYLAVQSMGTIADILHDKELKSIAEKYGVIAYEDDASEPVDPDETGTGAEVVAIQVEPVRAANTEKSTVLNVAASPETGRSETDKTNKITYKEKREKLMEKFLRRCDVVTAGEEESNDSEMPG